MDNLKKQQLKNMMIYGGVYTGTVKDVRDPKNLNRVRVHLPYFDVPSKKFISTWAEVITPYGGLKDTGMIFHLRPGMNVKVMFENCNPSRPIVLGTVYKINMNTNIYNESLIGNEVPQEVQSIYKDISGIKSIKGHRLYFDDTDQEEGVELKDSFGSGMEIRTSFRKDSIRDDKYNIKKLNNLSWQNVDGVSEILLKDGNNNQEISITSAPGKNTGMVRIKCNEFQIQTPKALITIDEKGNFKSEVESLQEVISNAKISTSNTSQTNVRGNISVASGGRQDYDATNELNFNSLESSNQVCAGDILSKVIPTRTYEIGVDTSQFSKIYMELLEIIIGDEILNYIKINSDGITSGTPNTEIKHTDDGWNMESSNISLKNSNSDGFELKFNNSVFRMNSDGIELIFNGIETRKLKITADGIDIGKATSDVAVSNENFVATMMGLQPIQPNPAHTTKG